MFGEKGRIRRFTLRSRGDRPVDGRFSQILQVQHHDASRASKNVLSNSAKHRWQLAGHEFRAENDDNCRDSAALLYAPVLIDEGEVVL